jgi:hypothetical protein
MKKLTVVIIGVLFASISFSQGVVDTFRLDVFKSDGIKYKYGYFNKSLIGPVFGRNSADTVSKIPGTIKQVNRELWIVDDLGHWVKSINVPDTALLASKALLNSRLDTVNKIATKKDLTTITAAVDTVSKIATKFDLTTVSGSVDTINKIATKYDILQVNAGTILDTSEFNRRSMNLSDVPNKALARANLGITTGGGVADTASNIPIRATKPTNTDNIWISSVDHNIHYRLSGWEYVIKVGSRDSIADYTPQNLLKASAAMNVGWWDFGNFTFVVNNVTDPFGGTTAETISIAYPYQPFPQVATVIPGHTYTFSAWYKLGTVTDAFGLSVGDLSHGGASLASYGVLNSSVINSSTWTRLSVTFTAPAGCTDVYCYLYQTTTEVGTLFAWGAQLNEGPIRPYTNTDDTIVP